MCRRFASLSARILPLTLLFAVGGCATYYPDYPGPPPSRPETPPSIETPQPQPVPSRPAPPPPARPVTGPAASLYQEARTALQQGNATAAEIMLERALRIEPRNPYYWHELAQASFAQGNHARTVQLCLKAESLAGADSGLREGNHRLLERARRAMGTRP